MHTNLYVSSTLLWASAAIVAFLTIAIYSQKVRASLVKVRARLHNRQEQWHSTKDRE